MAYNDVIDRSEAGALIPEDASREILQTVSEGSTVLRLARRLPNMPRAARRLPVLSVLPQVNFVGEQGRSPQTFTQLKQTAQAAWSNVYINAEEIACIVPIPENVLEDTDYDVWGELRPQIVSAIGAKIDYSLLFGTQDVDVPVSWPDGLLQGMPAAHIVDESFGDDLYDAILSEGGCCSYVENDGYFVNGFIAALNLRAKLRGLRNTQGTPIFVQDMKAATPYSLDGTRLEFPLNGGFDTSQATLICGDWNQLVWALRKDISYKLLTEGVITDENKLVVFNLAQEDMVALRVTFRMGWALPNPVNRINSNNTTRYPFAALVPVGS